MIRAISAAAVAYSAGAVAGAILSRINERRVVTLFDSNMLESPDGGEGSLSYQSTCIDSDSLAPEVIAETISWQISNLAAYSELEVVPFDWESLQVNLAPTTGLRGPANVTVTTSVRSLG